MNVPDEQTDKQTHRVFFNSASYFPSSWQSAFSPLTERPPPLLRSHCSSEGAAEDKGESSSRPHRRSLSPVLLLRGRRPQARHALSLQAQAPSHAFPSTADPSRCAIMQASHMPSREVSIHHNGFMPDNSPPPSSPPRCKQRRRRRS